MSPMSLDELKQRESVLYPERRTEEVMSKQEVKNVPLGRVVEKECRGCHKVKNFSEYKKSSNGRYGYASRCNECVKLDEDRATNKLSEKIRVELPNIPESKEEFTIEYISNRLKTSKSKTSQALKKLDEDGILTHIYKARTKYYSIAKTEPAKSSYDDITDALPKPVKEVKPEMTIIDDRNDKIKELQAEIKELNNVVEYHKADADRHYENWKRELAKRNVLEQKIEQNESDPITQKDLEDLEKIGIKSYPITKEGHITEIVNIAYKNAESIEINPQTHELKIKMKG